MQMRPLMAASLAMLGFTHFLSAEMRRTRMDKG